MHFISRTILALLTFSFLRIGGVTARDVSIGICDNGSALPCSDGGVVREAAVHFPKDISPGSKLPLVLNLHALMSSPKLQADLTDFNETADDESFIVVYPKGLAKGEVPKDLSFRQPILNFYFEFFLNLLPGVGTSWNAGGCCGSASSLEPPVDEIKFFRTLIKHIENCMTQDMNGASLDMERIYVTGMSNGGFMVNRVACEMSDVIAAAAPVAGPLMDSTTPEPQENFLCRNFIKYGSDENFKCEPENPVPLLHIHGEHDSFVPIDGKQSFLGICDNQFGFPSANSSIEFWRRNNGVLKSGSYRKSVSKYDGDLFIKTTCTSYLPESGSERAAVVQFCEHNSRQFFGHCWPSEKRKDDAADPADNLVLHEFGKCRNGIGSKYIWDFLSKHKRVSEKAKEDYQCPTHTRTHRSEL